MKLLFLNYEYPPLGGGAGIATQGLLREWAKRTELEVHLVTSAVGRGREEIHLGGRVYIHRLPIGKRADKLHSQSLRDILVYSWQALLFLLRFLPEENKKERFDITLAFFTLPCGFLAYLMKCFYGLPYAVSLRGADVPGFSEKYDGFYLFIKPLVRFLWKKAVVVIPNSLGIHDLAKKTSAEQAMEIVENGVDTETFQRSSEKRNFEPLIFLSTSRLTARKGVDTLIRAFAEACQKSSRPMELQLIGDGEQKEALLFLVQSLAVKEHVKFLGRIDNNALPAFYQKAHVFVLPSKNEGMSNSALEALASGLPLVVSGTGGMPELVTDGENGFFVDSGDIEGFAATLLKFSQDYSLVEKLGAASRRRAETRSWQRTAEKFLDLLRSVLPKS